MRRAIPTPSSTEASRRSARISAVPTLPVAPVTITLTRGSFPLPGDPEPRDDGSIGRGLRSAQPDGSALALHLPDLPCHGSSPSLVEGTSYPRAAGGDRRT